MKILIGGDLVVDTVYDPITSIDEDLINLFNVSDLNVINLEAPVTNYKTKILKTGPHLKSNKKSTNEVLEILKVNIATLANNHIFDYGEQGIKDTLFFCEQNNILTVGAGMNLKEASKTLFFQTPAAGKIAFVNISENEWASAKEDVAGANPMSLIDNVQQIQNAKLQADFVFLIIHGGHEYYNLPSPQMRKRYRFYADQGVDIIIGHHTHCISGFETYKNTPIYYSLGNFLFTKNSRYDDWYTGLILEVNIENSKLNCLLHPIKQEKDSFKLELLGEEEKSLVMSRVNEYSSIINNDVELLKEWCSFVDKKYSSYLNNWSILSFIRVHYLRRILEKLNIRFLNKRGISRYFNYMRCESHLELSKDVITKYLQK